MTTSAQPPADTAQVGRFKLSTRPPLRQLWGYAGGHRKTVVFATVMSIVNKACDVAPELLIGAAVDVVVNNEQSFIGRLFNVENRVDQLSILAVITAITWMAESLSQYIAHVSWRNLAQTIQHETRMDAYAHVQNLEVSYFEDHSAGGIMTVLNEDVNQLERFLDVGADQIIVTIANVIFVGVAFVVISPLLTGLAFLPIPIIIAGSLMFQRRLQPRYDEVRAAASRIGDTLTNNLGGIATIKAFSGERREVDRVGTDSQTYREVNGKAIALSSAFVPLIRMAILAGFIMTLVVGGRATLRGDLPVGLFSVLVFMTQRLLWPLTRLGEVLDLYQRSMASCRRIFGLLETKPTITPGTIDLPEPVQGEIKFDHVNFAYNDGPQVLTELTLHVPAGETHAIVGATGSGKSTLVKLLLRLYEPNSGSISFDGHALDQLTFTSLRGATGFVAQEVFLFHGTVAENIAYGRPGATREQIVRAAELAEADGFIRKLPGGYDSLVGERGQKLSGGQRQRITIARALLRDPAVLILDEATSAIDNETEAAIQRSLERVSVERTTVIIAHRLSTIRHAHRIHVMEAGQIVESGTHEELVAFNGLYAAMWRVQTGERTGGEQLILPESTL